MRKDVITIDIDDSIKNAAILMKTHKIGSLVVTGAKKTKGILTAEDIVYKHVAEGKCHNVADIMSTTLITIDPSKSIEEASHLMVEHKIKKLPVMEGDKIIGIITASDIVRVEPVLFETLLERLKIGDARIKPGSTSAPIEECESCGNFSDDIQDFEGKWLCSDCKG